MAIRFSTKLRNMLLGGATSRHVASLTATDIGIKTLRDTPRLKIGLLLYCILL